MSEVQKDPFDEASWGSLRNEYKHKRIVERALFVMDSLGKMFAQAESNSPKFEFVLGGPLPTLGKFVTPLGSAEIRLLCHFENSSRPGESDQLKGTIVVFVLDPSRPESQWRQVDWRVAVSQYDAVTAFSGNSQRQLTGSGADLNLYQSGMALYRAIIETK